MKEVQKGKVRIYACGGGGINIGHRFEQHRNRNETAFAQVDVVYIDTSKSNLRSDIDPKHCYMLDGLDGSGKVRAENYNEISSRIRDILQQFEPGDLNVVLSTAAGGSGSVIAPSLVGELLESECPVVVIAIGSADTRLDTENTLKTLKSYEAIAKMRKAPVVMSYVQNGQSMSRAKADDHAEYVITSLCALFSRENREMDSRDLFNWLRFDRVTTFPAQLAALSLLGATDEFTGIGNTISVATLALQDANSALANMPEYQCVGFLPNEAKDVVKKDTPLHFVISDGIFGDVASSLQTILSQLGKSQAARIKKSGLLSDADNPTESGLVL